MVIMSIIKLSLKRSHACVRYLRCLFTVAFIGDFKSVKTCMLPVQYYTRNRRGLGEISQERSFEGGVLLGEKKTFVTEQLLRTGITSLLLFRERVATLV